MITSVNNERIKYFVKLKEIKYIKKEGLFLVSSPHIVTEALKAGIVTTVILKEDYEFDTDIEIVRVSENVMKKLSSEKSVSEVMAVCKTSFNNELTDKIIILDNVQDPGNVGTIIRSSKAFGFDTVVLSNDSVNIFNDKLIRATEGMIFNTNIIKIDLLPFIEEIKKIGYKVIGTDLKTNNYSIDATSKLAIIVGNEGSGVSKEVLELCDDIVKIKISEDVESLNVAIASAILMYEVSK